MVGIGKQSYGAKRIKRAIAGLVLVFRSRERVSRFLEAGERRPRRRSNVEASSRAGVSAFSPPIDEAPHQIGWVKGTGGEERVGEGQCHRGIVSPLPGLKAEGSASGHLRMVRSRVSRTELDRGAQRIADRKSQERAYGAVDFLLANLFGDAVLVPRRGSTEVHVRVSGRSLPSNRFSSSFRML